MNGEETGTMVERAAREALRYVFDPELGVNVVDLGLLVSLKEDAGSLSVEYRLTSPTCPVGSMVAHAMDDALRAVPGVLEVTLTQVDDPPWSPDCISPVGRTLLGL